MRRTWKLLTALAVVLVIFGGGTAVIAQEAPTVEVDPDRGLEDGDMITVSISGFPANDASFISGMCVTPLVDALQQCDLANITSISIDENGEGEFELEVRTGAIGDGTCGEGEDQCIIMVGSLTMPDTTGFANIYFGADLPADEVVEELALTGFTTTWLLMIGAGILALGTALMWSRTRLTRVV